MEVERDELSPREELVLRAGARVRRGLRLHQTTGLWLFEERRFVDAVEAVAAGFEPAGIPLSVVLGDLDHFERLNDELGHDMGDRVLAEVGRVLSSLVRPLDQALAGGGDAFLLVLLGADLDVAAARAETARRALARLELTDGPDGVTASFGVAHLAPDEAPAALFDRAFEAQLRAKALGRDRVEAAAP